MSELTNKQKRTLAETLYVRAGLTQKEIAEKVGSSERTISEWKQKFNWEKLKAVNLITRSQQLQMLYAQLNEINTVIEQRQKPEGNKYADSKEADIIMKLSASIEKMEKDFGISTAVDVFTKFLDFMRNRDLKKAQEVSEYADDFVKTLL